ncbi:hypothetical protein [Bacillus sp. FJAT-29814]|uniref:hypothetical protein n=1 Tax=Bacillus sp. FJAT-29814 TaxID=1729688 RepID=UPI00082A7A36|nr:hypothetical protein [Bacillus sp. FJAT-29814]
MVNKRKSRAARMLAIVLAVLLVTYNIPFGMFTSVFAEEEPTEELVTQEPGVEQPPQDPSDEEPPGENDPAPGDGQEEPVNPAPDSPDPVTHDISVTTIGSGTVRINGTDYQGKEVLVPVPDGEGNVIKIIPGEGHQLNVVEIDHETIDLADLTANQDGSYDYTVEKVSKPYSISVTFAANIFTLTFQYDSDKGKVLEGDKIISAGGFVEQVAGSTPEFKVVPQTTYHVSSIMFGTIPIEIPVEYTKSTEVFNFHAPEVKGDVTVKVEFEKNSYNVTNVASDNGVVTLDDKVKEGETTVVEEGSNVSVTMVPDFNYTVDSIKITKDGASTIITEGIVDNDSSFTYTVENITGDTTIEVTFIQLEVLMGPWSEYVTITASAGSLTHKDPNKEMYVFSNGAKVNIEPKSEYTKLFLTTSDKSQPKSSSMYTITSNTSIKEMKVKIGNKRKSERKINLPEDILILFDTQNPTVEKPVLEGPNHATVNGKDWYSGAVKIPVAITNTPQDYFEARKLIATYASEIDKVYYSKDAEATVQSVENRLITTADKDYQGVYKITAVDKAGNPSSVRDVPINIDKTAPTLAEGRAVKVEKVNDDLVSKIINIISLGFFANEGIKVTVLAKDEASGIQDISLIAHQGDSSKTVQKLDPTKFDDKTKKTATGTFLLNDDSFDGTFSVEVTDNVNNKEEYEVTKDNVEPEGNANFVIDRVKPNVEIKVASDTKEEPYIDGDTEYYPSDVKLNVKAEDQQSGVQKVTVKLNNKEIKTYDFSEATEKQTNPVLDQIDTSTLKDNGRKYTFSVDVEDNAGNKNSAATQREKIVIDEAAPELEKVQFDVVNDSTIARTLNFLTFGTFFNKKINITVNVKDDASGIKDVILQAVKAGADKGTAIPAVEDSLTKTGLTAEKKFELDVDSFKGTFQVVVADNVGNKNQVPYQVTSLNSNIQSADSGIVMIEKTNPEAEIKITPFPGETYYNNPETGAEYYSGDVTFDVQAKDADSGVNAVKIDVNGTVINNGDDPYYFYDNNTKATMVTDNIKPIRTNDEGIAIDQDGSYTINVETVDNALNGFATAKKIFKDTKSPDKDDFEFNFAVDEQYVNPSDTLTNYVELTEYGFFFKKPITVTIKAKDFEEQDDFDATSGLKSLTIYLQDYEKGKTYAVTADGFLAEIDGTAVEGIAGIPTAEAFGFTVPAAFKGQIFAKATDNVNNSSEFVTPNGTVIEDEAQHAKETHIAFKKGETKYKDNNNLELYSHNVDVKLTVTDTYSGLKQVEWWVEAPYDRANNQYGKLEIGNDGNFLPSSHDAGWSKDKVDHNLVTEMSKIITVSNNSNDIKVKAKITDQAGNTTEQDLKFSIDKTAPTIKVTYDNNTADPVNPDYFKADRTATIVVTERNFTAKDVEYLITNTDGVIPSLVGWSTTANAQDPDKTTHTATVKYTADGDYTFNIKYKDNAGNAAPAVPQDRFTIDKTIPVIQVSYSNNAAANGNYYKAARTATISITEHNFDPSRVKITGSASDNGNPAAFPNVSGWSARGDVHTATIQYGTDGKYSFDIDFVDMAGNQAADYKSEEFVIDQTAPQLSITGVGDQTANNGDVIPVVSYSDTNFNKNAVSIKLTGAIRGPVTLDGAYTDGPNGQVFTFNNFEKKKEVDDLYTLTATLTDFAGNESTQTIHFSVNRFGSVYAFDDSLKNIKGKYVQKEMDVILTETNVDSLKQDSINVKMTKNGTPSDLVEGKDYTVTETGGSGQWSQYKYVIKKTLFAGDGKYTVALYSEDAAGNINENIDEKKQAEISFGIDKTAPVIVPIDIESGEQYPLETKTATVSVKDNLVLEGATFYLNGEKVKHEQNGENFTFDIQSSNIKQHVKIVAVDAAGNELTKEVNDILVSTNPIVRWYNNTPLFAGSIGGIGGLAIAITALVLYRRQKKLADVEKQAS